MKSGMSLACRVSWTGQQLNKKHKSFEFNKLLLCLEMVLSMQWFYLTSFSTFCEQFYYL
jgi:hypothetical protein